MRRIGISLGLLLALGAAGCRSTQRFAAAEPTKPPLPSVVPAAFEEGVTPSAEPSETATEEAVLNQPEEIAAEQITADEGDAEPGATVALMSAEAPTLEDVVRSVVEFFPVIQQATQERSIAYGKVLEASGAFDHKFDLFAESQPHDFYENHRGSAGIKRNTTWGGQTFAGYRIGRGNYEPWYLERETNDGGEFKAGFVAPLVRDRDIDANRSELWQAQVEQTRAEVTIQTAVIAATREAAAAYWGWVAAGEKLGVAERVLQLGLDRVEGIDSRIKAGEAKEIEAVDNQRVIVSRQAKVIDAERKLRQSAAKLSLYLRGGSGQPLQISGRAPADAFAGVGDLAAVLADDGARIAQANRPEPRSLQLTSRQLGIAIRQACNETIPDVDGGLLFGQDVGGPTSADDKQEFEIEAKITMSVPLERRKAFGKLRQLRGKLAQVRAKQRLVRDKIGIEVEVARAALEAAALRVEQTTEGVRLARQMADAERALYEAGDSDLFSLNIREKQAADAALERIDALLDYHLAAADYAAALGVSQTELVDGVVVPEDAEIDLAP